MLDKSTTLTRTDSDFISQGQRCSGWLYLPEDVKNPPITIMGHGFAAEKTFRLPAFAERFVKNGMAVFMFDYRTFGGSEGEPRNNVNPFHHGKDWDAAINHVKQLDEIDTTRIALWGSSFAGGHVIYAATRHEGITAIVSQVPFVDGIASMLMTKPLDLVKAVFAGLWDVVKSTVMRKPYYVKAVAKPGEFAAMNTEESWQGYTNLVPEDSAWENKIPAKVFLMIPLYSPLIKASKVTCQALIIAAENDSLIPVKAVRWTAGRIKKGELVVLECNHFEPYYGEWFEKIVTAETEFLLRCFNNNP